jgi:polyhydroxyalkanoate synthesis repressor PhaR
MQPTKRLVFAAANVIAYAQKMIGSPASDAKLMLNKADPPSDKKEPVVIKKYANRRLYNTETSTYVTLDDLAAMVKSERDFVVFDAKTGDDLTHAVLTQIIVDQESQKRGETLLPIPFLRQLIRFYGASIERFVPSYLQASLETLAKEQERFRKQFAGAFTPAGAFEAYQEQARKNLAMFEQAMLMFSPFGHNKSTGAGGKSDEEAKKPEAPKSQQSEEIAELKAQLASIQSKLDKLSEASNK